MSGKIESHIKFASNALPFTLSLLYGTSSISETLCIKELNQLGNTVLDLQQKIQLYKVLNTALDLRIFTLSPEVFFPVYGILAIGIAYTAYKSINEGKGIANSLLSSVRNNFIGIASMATYYIGLNIPMPELPLEIYKFKHVILHFLTTHS